MVCCVCRRYFRNRCKSWFSTVVRCRIVCAIVNCACQGSIAAKSKLGRMWSYCKWCSTLCLTKMFTVTDLQVVQDFSRNLDHLPVSARFSVVGFVTWDFVIRYCERCESAVIMVFPRVAREILWAGFFAVHCRECCWCSSPYSLQHGQHLRSRQELLMTCTLPLQSQRLLIINKFHMTYLNMWREASAWTKGGEVDAVPSSICPVLVPFHSCKQHRAKMVTKKRIVLTSYPVAIDGHGHMFCWMMIIRVDGWFYFTMSVLGGCLLTYSQRQR